MQTNQEQINGKRQIHLCSSIFFSDITSPVEYFLNGNKQSVMPIPNKLAFLSRAGILAVAVIEGAPSFSTAYFFGRGWSQPDGIRDEEAQIFGADLGEKMRREGVEEYELIVDGALLERVDNRYIGNLEAYKKGIDSALSIN